MKRKKTSSGAKKGSEVTRLRSRLAELEQTLLAITSGEVDTVMVPGKMGDQVFTLEGAEHPYRILIESMQGGALTLTENGVILYANQCFASMVKRPLDQILGIPFDAFISTDDRAILRPLFRRQSKSSANLQITLSADSGPPVPAQIAMRPLKKQTFSHATVGMVITDMTEARRNEEKLRALTHRVFQAQETERGRIAHELHDGITQMLCAISFQSQALLLGIPAENKRALAAAAKMGAIAAATADEVERISSNLRPNVLKKMGLTSALRQASTEFSKRTGISVKVDCVVFSRRLPIDMELALYRILQEGLRNVEKHSQARHVKVRLSSPQGFILLQIADDGIGFDPNRIPIGKKGKHGLGLLSMLERTTHLGGTFNLTSKLSVGSKIEVRIPLLQGKARQGKARQGGLKDETTS